jgi:hypothetical protein
MNYLNLSMLIYVGYFMPFSTRFRSRVEVINEIFITVDTFHFMLFTDFVGQPDTQYLIGWSLIVHITLHILFNLAIVLQEKLHLAKLLFLRYWNRGLSMAKRWLRNMIEWVTKLQGGEVHWDKRDVDIVPQGDQGL